ncbi:MAG: hypothetical protein OP8BY_0417 [Candidatus Saccharicenans subterraneus]|uniref:Uncharacterized protein n=1 Tax=Candidatus Saccharicenans subterraneus TaxID=2508984 RepID=A0A3E2BKP7_9BACT|nr:MAG: hypothetical protein OP8BY_0417 [Candidatus Saccharicenans subterraneum]
MLTLLEQPQKLLLLDYDVMKLKEKFNLKKDMGLGIIFTPWFPDFSVIIFTAMAWH